MNACHKEWIADHESGRIQKYIASLLTRCMHMGENDHCHCGWIRTTANRRQCLPQKTQMTRMSSEWRRTDWDFETFWNNQQKIWMLFHIYKCSRIWKSNQKRASEVIMPAEWQYSKISLQDVTRTRKMVKSTKCYIHFYNFPESSAKIF